MGVKNILKRNGSNAIPFFYLLILGGSKILRIHQFAILNSINFEGTFPTGIDPEKSCCQKSHHYERKLQTINCRR